MSKDKDGSEEAAGLVGMLLNADESTLAIVDQQMSDLQREIADFVSARQSRIEALKVLRRVIDVQVHGRRKRGSNAPRLPTKTESHTDKIVQLLRREGSMPLPSIAAYLQIAPVVAGKIIKNSPLFDTRFGEVHLVGDE